MMNLVASWQFWAILSAIFAALTAIFAKVGVEDINSDLATFIRTVVILPALAIFIFATGQFRGIGGLTARSLWFLVLSGLATAVSWLAYFRALKLGDVSQVAPIDKLSVVFIVVLGVLILGEKFTIANWLGIALMLLGALLISN